MKEYYQELCCDNCQTIIGYMIMCGPRGSIICQDCYEIEESEEDITDE